MKLTEKELERFMSRVNKTDTCWLWTGSTAGKGYGAFRSKVSNRAHRVSYSHFIGDIPEGLVLDHKCRQRNCVRPDHLEPVTNRENILRGIGLSALNALKTHCPRGHPYTEDNTYLKRRTTGYLIRSCKTCELQYHKQKRQLSKQSDLKVS